MQLRYIILLLLIINCTSVKSQQLAHSVKAHFKQISLLFNIDEKGAPTYTVHYNNQPVILSSALGFGLADGKQLTQNFEIVGIDSTENNSTWQPVWGEVKEIKDHHKQICFRLKQKNPPFIQLNIVFKLFEEGVGFKYEFPNQPGLRFFTITNEHTEFNLAGNHTAFWIPGDYDSNEYTYRQTKLNEVDAWQFPLFNNSKIEKRIPFNNLVQTPLMLKTANGLYINIHEAALVNYSALYLQVNKNNFSLKASLVPDAEGNMAYLRTPANTPWRTIIVSDKAKDILASKMILNLNEPSKITETGWIKPMKFMGVWWEMQTGKSAWSYTNNVDTTDANGRLIPHGKHAANTENVLKYIDFAAQFGIEGLLIEGWNKGWEEWTDVWKEQNFDYVTPYPDFDLPRITAYAKQKNVQLIMHNETGGSATNYDRLLDTAYRFMTQNGYKAVKTGYVGKIIPNGEH
ncbi:MAG: glycoside hydrolase family 97 N-terminal domain-containing protein, partial [Chitinophagaceae bacterium]